jgi:hypothetical protein
MGTLYKFGENLFIFKIKQLGLPVTQFLVGKMGMSRGMGPISLLLDDCFTFLAHEMHDLKEADTLASNRKTRK